MTTHTSIITLAALASLAATALTPTTASARAGGTPGGPAAAVGSNRSVQKPGPAFRTPGAMLARNHGSAQPTVPAKLTILSPYSGNTASKKVRKFDPTTPIQTSGKLDPTTPVTQIPDKKPPVIIGQLGPKPNPGTPVITGNPDPVNGTPRSEDDDEFRNAGC